MDINPEVLVVPNGLPGLSPLKLDLKGIFQVESRIQEIATLTIVKAPELMSVFNKAYCDLVGMIFMVQLQYELARKYSNEVKAVVLLDKVSDILKSKGLATSTRPTGSEDFRQAVLDLDPDYQVAQDKIMQLKSILMLLEGKQKSIDMAYTATKKVYGDTSQFRHSQDTAYEPNRGSNNTNFFKNSKY